MHERKEAREANTVGVQAAVQQQSGPATRGGAAALRGQSYDRQVQMLSPGAGHDLNGDGRTSMKEDFTPIGEDAMGGGSSEVAASAGEAATGGGTAAAATPKLDKDGFNENYARADGQVHSHVGTYKDYKASIKGMGKTKSASSGGGNKMTARVTLADLRKVFDGVDKDLTGGVVTDAVVQNLLDQCNNAFETMLIDTVEARAAFFANAYSESNQFRLMTETQGSKAATAKAGKSQNYESDPKNVKLDTAWLDQAAGGKVPGVGGYQTGGEIRPKGGMSWEESFIGRGAIQTTHRDFYVQAIAVLEKRYEELDPATAQATQLKEAIDKIKEDPRNAADPKYAFLFGAANMQMPSNAKGKTGATAVSAPGADPTSFMGPQDDKKPLKLAAFERAKKVFKERQVEEDKLAAAAKESEGKTGP